MGLQRVWLVVLRGEMLIFCRIDCNGRRPETNAQIKELLRACDM